MSTANQEEFINRIKMALGRPFAKSHPGGGFVRQRDVR